MQCMREETAAAGVPVGGRSAQTPDGLADADVYDVDYSDPEQMLVDRGGMPQADVRQITELMQQEREVGRTTVLKTMQRLEGKGLLVRVPGEGPVRFRMSRQPGQPWRISEFDPEWVRRRAREEPIRIR